MTLFAGPTIRAETPTTTPSERTVPRAIEIEELGNGNVLVSNIGSGSRLPIGGSLFNRSQHSIYLRIDPENLERFLSRVDESISQIPLPAITKWLGQINAQINSAVYAPCDVFGKVFDSQYRNSSPHSFERSQLIGENGGQPALSQVLEAKLAECAEIAALAQIMLQRQGITSWYVGGALLSSREHEYPEAHSYILIRHCGEYFIWDPANPVSTTIGNLPAIYPVTESYLKGIRSGQETFLCELLPIIGTQSGIFGISDCSGVSPEMIQKLP